MMATVELALRAAEWMVRDMIPPQVGGRVSATQCRQVDDSILQRPLSWQRPTAGPCCAGVP